MLMACVVITLLPLASATRAQTPTPAPVAAAFAGESASGYAGNQDEVFS
ncbi:MAG: hypothetical protein QM692_08845 [Thermomicrobiales bacterium]